MILIAGPFASGTGGDPELMQANLARLEEAAWPIFELGHVPMIGEWVAIPALRSGGITDLTEVVAKEVLDATASRLIRHCNAVFRLPGASRGADMDVALARELNIPVFFQLSEIPKINHYGIESASSTARLKS